MADTPTEAIELLPCGKCGAPCRVETFRPSKHIETPVMLWVCAQHQRFGGECPSDLAYFNAEAWNESSAPQEPDDDALIRRLAVSIAEHRAHINGLQEQYGAGAVPDERCAGIVLNFGDVIDLYARLQAKPETPYCRIVVMPGDEGEAMLYLTYPLK